MAQGCPPAAAGRRAVRGACRSGLRLSCCRLLSARFCLPPSCPAMEADELSSAPPSPQGSRGHCLCDGRVHPAVPGAGSRGLTGLRLLHAGSPGREAPFRLRLSSEMRNTLRRKWCLLAVALGTNGMGRKGENGLLCLAGPGLQGVPSWGGRPCVVGGPLPGWPSSPGLQGALCGGWPGSPRKAQELWEWGGWWAPLSPPRGTPTPGMCGVRRCTRERSPAWHGRAVCSWPEARGRGFCCSSAWHQALSLLPGLWTFSSL